MFINYPNNPTTQVATKEFYKEAITFCKKHNIILAISEQETENYYDQKPNSVLELEKNGIIVIKILII